jgi:hypothetical protein
VQDILTGMGAALNVLNTAYAGGADPTGAADSTAAINAALAAASPGQAVTGQGVFKTTGPIVVPSGVELRGTVPATQSGNNASSDWGFVLKPAASWSAGAQPVPGVITFNAVNRPSVRDVWIDGSASAAGVDGIASYGAVNAASILRCGIYHVTGNGISAVPDGGGNGPDGWHADTMVVQQAGGHGVTGRYPDAALVNVHCQQCTGDGFSLTAGGNIRLIGCRADLNTNGFTLDCYPGSGYGDSVLLLGCGTQRNARNGLNVINSSVPGTDKRLPVIAAGCSFDGDGVNGGAGGGGYAGIAVAGNNKVLIDGTNVMVLTVDVAGGCPQYALATAASGTGPGVPASVVVSAGLLNYVTAAVNNAAPATGLIVAPGVTAAAGYNPSGGTPLSSGTAVLAAGTATVNSALVTAGAVIIVTCQVPGGTPGFLRVSARTAGTSFTITSSSGTDTSTAGWVILGP